ncbi:MAG: methylated-DNA--[protein]-cysteine S-methyltransferase [Alistipes sp.]|jgi:methylated-DNA-[protein]-cysteine S-methyltransferase
MTFSCCVESIVGPLTVVSDESVVTAIRFGRMLDNGDDAVRPDVLRQAVQELNDFFVGKRHVFTVPVGPVGTLFQQEVWAALRAIPYGETRSYRDIARAVGRPAACRAVGMANHDNPIPIIIPCHRVVGADGRLTGYAGGLEIKSLLLRLEQEHRACADLFFSAQ